MRKLAILAALASTALASPAVAHDKAWYVGVEAGAMLVEDTKLDFHFDDGVTELDVNDGVIFDHKLGFDGDLIAGYDFGGFRLEGELGWKRAGLDEAQLGARIVGGTSDQIVDVDGSVRVLSAMINGLLDFGDDDGWNGYVGGGLGLARIKHVVD